MPDLPSALAFCQSSHVPFQPHMGFLFSLEGIKNSPNLGILYLLFSLLRTFFTPNITKTMFHVQVSIRKVISDHTIQNHNRLFTFVFFESLLAYYYLTLNSICTCILPAAAQLEVCYRRIGTLGALLIILTQTLS